MVVLRSDGKIQPEKIGCDVDYIRRIGLVLRLGLCVRVKRGGTIHDAIPDDKLRVDLSIFEDSYRLARER